jgi:LytR cell envelope-related transcriptional attenuator
VADLLEGNTLLNDLKTFMITSGGWNIVQFAGEMQNLTGRNLVFQTLPIVTEENNVMLNGRLQDINIVDPAYLKKYVNNLFYPAPPAAKKAAPSAKPAASIPPASTVTVDVYNGGSTPGLAGDVSQALVSAGYKAGAVEDASTQSEPVQAVTQVFYGSGAAANAAKIANYFGVTAAAAASVPAGHVEILLGTASTVVPAGIGSSTANPGATASPSASATSAANDGQAGGAVTVAANAPYGIPCVD